MGETALLAPYVVGHFFLFCNVFRVRRKPELVWAGIFLASVAVWVVLGFKSILGMLGLQLIATAVVIIREMKSPYYHGILSRRVNPRIEDYLAGKLD